MSKEKKKHRTWVSMLIWIGRAAAVIVVCFALLVVYLSVSEYKPADQEELTVEQTSKTVKTLQTGSSLSIMTWNVGYGALGDNADFFMDGGSSVYTADEDRVNQNLNGISETISSVNPDVVFLQEVDLDSDRSYHTNEKDTISANLNAEGNGYSNSTFAYNFKVSYVPYPIPPIGKVNSGILTMTNYTVSESTRYQLPCPFSWPVRLVNLKRCLMVDRIPIVNADGTDSGKELVLVNLHLEAYDSGEGKTAQTKMLREILQSEEEKGNYVIAGGDFNQTFSNTDDSMYPEQDGTWHCGEIDESEFDSSWQFVMDNETPTCRSLDKAYQGADTSDFQYYMIDGYIVSSNISVSSVQTLDEQFANTDHNPVVMQVQLGD